MARMIPSQPNPGTPFSERRVFSALSHLTDDWTVMHSVSWQSVRNGRQGDGEADFILLNRSIGAIILEVKGGEIHLEEGSWFSIDHSGARHDIRNPFAQATTSKHTLVRYIARLRPRLRKIMVSHAVAFPTITIDHDIAMYGPRDIILDASDLDNIQTSVARIAAHWEQKSSMSDECLALLLSHLAPTIRLTVRLRDTIREARQVILSLTERQIDAFRLLRRMRRVLVEGPAGSGKTILAMERARQLDNDGFTVLLLCYNALLAEHMRNELNDTTEVRTGTFHATCLQEIRAASLPVPDDVTQDWWDNVAPELLVDAFSINGQTIDAVVIDEGQDFAPRWLFAASFLLSDPKDGPIYVFADANQDLYHRSWSIEDDFYRAQLDFNCRNTQQIGARVASLCSDAEYNVLGPEGPEPTFLTSESADHGLHIVNEIVGTLIEDEDIHPSAIVVLSDSRYAVNRLHTMTVGEWSFTQWGGTGVVSETIHRFKGLESEIVVLLLTDGLVSNRDALRSISYVGMSRARTVLYVVSSSQVEQALK